MAKRIERDIFYDPAVVGIAHVGEEEPEGRHRGVDGEQFFREDDPLADVEHPIPRLARHPWSFASLMLLAGFFTVFVAQAPIIYQIVFGAPIFEELLKFGLAMVLSLAIIGVFRKTHTWTHRAWMFLSLPVALAVGAGFGVMEHYLTYSAEPDFIYLGRVIFHAGATVLTMATLYAVATVPDVRIRWLAPLPAAIVHYLNNAGALVVGIPLGLIGADTLALLYHLGILGLTVGAAFFMTVAPRVIRGSLQRLVSKAFPANSKPRVDPLEAL